MKSALLRVGGGQPLAVCQEDPEQSPRAGLGEKPANVMRGRAERCAEWPEV